MSLFQRPRALDDASLATLGYPQNPLRRVCFAGASNADPPRGRELAAPRAEAQASGGCSVT